MDDAMDQSVPYQSAQKTSQGGSKPRKKTASPSSSSFEFAMGMFIVFIIFPLLLALTSFVFGGILAWAEDWKFLDGFYYIVGNLCGLATPLTDVTPDSTGGKLVDVFIALASVSVSAAVITMVGYFSIWNTLMRRFEGAMHLQLADGHSHSPESQTSPEHILASDSDSARTIATLQRENALLRGLLDAKEGHESNSLGPLATQQEGAEQVEVEGIEMMATHKISELSNTLARQDTTLAAQQGMLIATNQKLDFVLAALEAREHKLRMSESMSDVSAMETDKTADGHRRSPEHNTEDALQQIKMELARQQEMLAATNQRLGTLLESNDSVSSKKLLQLFEAELESKSQQTGR